MATAQLYASAQELLRAANDLAADIKYVGLYQNPAALVKGFDPAILWECDFSNYGRIDLTGLWATAVIDGNGNGTASCPLQTFTKSGATANPNVWGMFYVATDGVTIIWAQQFADGPYPMTIDGDLIRLTPLISTSGPIFP